MNDDKVQAALGDLTMAGAQQLLSAPTIAALQLTDVLTSAMPQVSDELQSELRRHFDEGQILELGTALAVASGWQKFIEAFGIRPDSWNSSDPAPVRPPD
jgi:alkylhydroperoxidase family enzyme